MRQLIIRFILSGVVIALFPVVLISCGNSDNDRISRQSEEYVMSAVDEFVDWLTEPGISEFELENRICEVHYRASQLEASGDTVLSRKFLEEVKARYDAATSN